MEGDVPNYNYNVSRLNKEGFKFKKTSLQAVQEAIKQNKLTLINEKIDTVIISGGLGTRFKKIQSIPKILTKFNNHLILDIIIKNLDRFGLKKFTFYVEKIQK